MIGHTFYRIIYTILFAALALIKILKVKGKVFYSQEIQELNLLSHAVCRVNYKLLAVLLSKYPCWGLFVRQKS